MVEIAGLRRRFASLVYEALLLLGVLALTFMLPNLIVGMVFKVTEPGWLGWVHIFVVLGAYFLWYWRGSGQTLAMQTWRLRVVTAQGGKPLSWRRALLRYVCCWPSVCLFGAGLWWAFLDRDRQFAHDRLAGTVVVLLPGRPS
ncbi:RDD family protein [Nitrogeniibacter mangrovi]|uniref:RDD family protein n=1 Tax=Nitrogeniibacter mangrovi TaxID=2016596 RepID=A0A6C1B7J9_9RHOO|nr:RDD family protein [Nitrogeniibacter mangrovi]